MELLLKRDEGFIPIKLKKRIGGGGEARVFQISQLEAVKIWKTSKRAGKLPKLKLMVENPFPSPYIAWPKELVYDENGEVVGYTMPFYEGGIELERLMRADNMKRPIFLPEEFRHFMYDGDLGSFWQKRIEIGLNLVKVLRELHSHSIKVIVGDLKPVNILILPDGEVKLVDTDGFQVGEFSCDAVTPEYAPPEYLEGKVSQEIGLSQLWDYYVFGVILYKLLFGMPPYVGTLKEGDHGDPNYLKKMRKFPFGKSKEDFEVLPRFRDGIHFELLLPELQELFIRNFEGYIRERPTLEEWTHALVHQYNKLSIDKERTSAGINIDEYI